METILITGANRGLGLEFVKQYLEQGHKVLATARQLKQASELNKLQTKYPNTLSLFTLDVTNLEHIQSLNNELLKQNIKIDLLINNAGSSGKQGIKIGNMPIDNFNYLFLVNSIMPLKICEQLLDLVLASNRKQIVCISSKMGSIADNDSGVSYAYRASKAALNAMMKSFSVDTKQQGAKVLLIHPGWVRTDMGGPNGLIDTQESVKGMIRIIDQKKSTSGEFCDYKGEKIPW